MPSTEPTCPCGRPVNGSTLVVWSGGARWTMRHDEPPWTISHFGFTPTGGAPTIEREVAALSDGSLPIGWRPGDIPTPEELQSIVDAHNRKQSTKFVSIDEVALHLGLGTRPREETETWFTTVLKSVIDRPSRWQSPQEPGPGA
jgi:hypothetical protein